MSDLNTNIRRPDWLKIKLDTSEAFQATKEIINSKMLNTVCVEARCPNIYECWNRKTATIMILGDVCTRACGFCSVKTGKPPAYDTMEPIRVSQAIKKMDLNHVVVTSVDRDDLRGDYGASIWADTINQIHLSVPGCSVEVLTPDFLRKGDAYKKLLEADLDVFNHNMETVESLYRNVRPGANYKHSLKLLKYLDLSYDIL